MNLKERIEQLNNILQNTPNISVSIPKELEQFIDYFNCPKEALEIIKKQGEIIAESKKYFGSIVDQNDNCCEDYETASGNSYFLANEILYKIKEMEENDTDSN